MNSVRAASPRLADLVPYDPKYLPAQVMVSANENPQNLPPEVLEGVLERLRGLQFNRYPDPLANELRDAIAAKEGLQRACVLLGNGGDELLFNIALCWGGPGRKMLTAPPTFSVYANNAQLTGTEVVAIPRLDDYRLDEAAILDRVAQGDIDYITITSPNNPTGQVARRGFLLQLLDATDALVMVDEAYGEFARESLVDALAQHRNLVILRTFSKAYSLAGVRIGYILADPQVINEFAKVRQPYSVDAVSQAIALEVMAHLDLFQARIDAIIRQRGVLMKGLMALPAAHPYPSDANYVLVRFDGVDAGRLWQRLLDRGVLVRDFSRAEGLENCLRISVGTAEENQRVLEALEDALHEQGM